MSKTYAPFRLKDFEVIEGKLSKEEVISEFKRMSDWMRKEQDYFYQNNLDEITELFMGGEHKYSGSKNSLGRKVGVTPQENYDFNSHNLSEMFRSSVMSHVAGYIQDTAIVSIINDENIEDSKIIVRDFVDNFPHLKKPTHMHTSGVASRLVNKGVVAGIPKGNGQLSLSATDNHFLQMKSHGRDLFMTIKMLGSSVTLKFRIPKSSRFNDGKITKPTVVFDDSNRILFYFTVQKDVPLSNFNQRVIGVDLGKVEEYVASIIDGGEMSYSAPYHARKKVKKITEQISTLWRHYHSNKFKQVMNEKFGHEKQLLIHKTECERIRARITRLKNERALTIAAHLVEIAELNNVSAISFEKLDWLGSKGGKWEHSMIQNATESRARKSGVSVRKVSAKGTSTTCPKCKKTTQATGRKRVCSPCRSKLDRDVSASRVIGVRAIPNASAQFKHYKQVLSVITRSSRRGTPVPVTYLQSVVDESKDSNNYNNME